jgi:hypothetical protein
MASFNLEKYATVAERIEEFYIEHPQGSIRTFVSFREGAEIMFEARVYRTVDEAVEGVYTSGFAHEVEGKSPVNRTSHVENCESSAVGRALANLGYTTTTERPSRSEMLKVGRMQKELEEMVAFIKEVGATLPAEATADYAGESRNITAFVRENWSNIKSQYRLARSVVEMIETASGTKFASVESE